MEVGCGCKGPLDRSRPHQQPTDDARDGVVGGVDGPRGREALVPLPVLPLGGGGGGKVEEITKNMGVRG